MHVTFEFDMGCELVIGIPARFESSSLFHAVRLLRESGRDPHKVIRCWLEGERRCRMVGIDDWVTTNDITKYLRNGLKDEKTDEQTVAVTDDESDLTPDPAHDVIGSGEFSHKEIAEQLEMRGYEIIMDHEDNEHSWVRHPMTGEMDLADIYGDCVATVTNSTSGENL